MKKLIIVILIIIFFGCNQPDNTKSNGNSGGTKTEIKTVIVPEGNLIDEKAKELIRKKLQALKELILQQPAKKIAFTV